MDWQPLSVREAKREPDDPFEGVPEHLSEALKQWLITVFRLGGTVRSQLVVEVGAAVRVSVHRNTKGKFDENSVTALAVSEDALLDAVDACLHLASPHVSEYEDKSYFESVYKLRTSFRIAGSVWTVDDDMNGLVRLVSPAATAAYKQVMSHDDAITAELRTAWQARLGRSPDASDSWDHSIKAVEAALIPIVTPKQVQPQLGRVLGELSKADTPWRLVLTPQQGLTSIETFVAMLRLIYPNPDRHTGPDHRVPSLAEAEAVLHLAVTIVQWARDGVIHKKPKRSSS